MNTGWKMFIRTSAIILYFVFFFGVYFVLHVYFGNTTTIQDSREYGEKNSPDYFPILVADRGNDDVQTLILRSLAKAEYSGTSTSKEQSWHFYQLIKGETGATYKLPHTSGVSYKIMQLSDKQLRVTIFIEERNDQRKSTYTYEIKANKVYPRSYLLSSSFGHNFSPIPFLVIITCILIYLSEKFLIKRLLKPSS